MASYQTLKRLNAFDDLNSYSRYRSAFNFWHSIDHLHLGALTPSLMLGDAMMEYKLVLLSIPGRIGWLSTQRFVASNVHVKPKQCLRRVDLFCIADHSVLAFTDLKDLMPT